MNQTRMTSMIGALPLAVGCNAALAQSPPRLTAQQEAIARHLDAAFMAPCCFANTLAEHHSPVAEDVWQEIRTMLAGGATEGQVIDAFVAKYGERILAAPKPEGFNLLAYVLPAVALAVGLLIIALVLPPAHAAGAAWRAVAGSHGPGQGTLQSRVGPFR